MPGYDGRSRVGSVGSMSPSKKKPWVTQELSVMRPTEVEPATFSYLNRRSRERQAAWRAGSRLPELTTALPCHCKGQEMPECGR